MPRRTKGNIIKLDNGNYKVRAKAGTLRDGKPNILNRTVKTKREAEYLLKVFLNEADRLKSRNNNITVLERTIEDYFVNTFLPHKSRTLKPQSYTRLESTIRVHIIPAHGDIKLANLRSEDIEILLDTLYENGKSFSTIKKVYDAYHSMFDYLVNKKHDMDIHNNPMDAISLVDMHKINNYQNKTVKWFTPHEIISIKNECEKLSVLSKRPVYRYHNMFMLIMNTGIREGEACALRKSSIDFTNKTITIKNNIYTDKRQLKMGTVKYANSERVVAVNSTALHYCSLLMQDFPDTEMLIYNERKEFVRPATLSKSFSRILKHANINEGTLHSLRHTYVSMLFDAGVDIYTIAAQIGDDPSTVQKTYLHLYQKRMANNIGGIDVVKRANIMLQEGISY